MYLNVDKYIACIELCMNANFWKLLIYTQYNFKVIIYIKKKIKKTRKSEGDFFALLTVFCFKKNQNQNLIELDFSFFAFTTSIIGVFVRK